MSFGWLGVFRQGAWQAFRSFVCRERADVGRRLSVIQAELSRIGSITVQYRRVDDETGQRVTEERVAFSVTPNSSLEKLIQAYIAKGGNPFDISHFFIPDRSVVQTEDVEGFVESRDNYPYGGVAYPQTAEPNEPESSFGAYPGGYIPLRKYLPNRVGSRRDLGVAAEPYVNQIDALRKSVHQEIRYKRDDLEARILKLCDLREQLIDERDIILTQAFGGLLPSLSSFDTDRYVRTLRAPRIVYDIDSIFYEQDASGAIDFETENTSELAKHENLFGDILPDEANTAI